MMLTEDCEIQTREELFIKLYEEVFPITAAFIHKAGGNLEEAKDVFQDALVIYYEKTRSADFRVQVSENAYLMGICKHLWLQKHRKDPPYRSLDLIAGTESMMQQEMIVSSSILKFVEQAGKKCLELLRAFYYEKRNMTQIAEQFNFSNEHSATAQKYKCLEKIRSVIKNKSVRKEDFYE